MKYSAHTYEAGELWETHWSYILLTKAEVETLFLDTSQSSRCWKRNGGEWRRYSGSYGEVPKLEVDKWLRDNCGHRSGEVWECDRFYYPDEKLPELPTGGGNVRWRERFICYPDRDKEYNTEGWTVGDSHEKDFRRYLGFRDKNGQGKVLATLFAMFFL